MRWRLFLAFSMIIIVTLGILGYSLSQTALKAVNLFAERGGFFGVDHLVVALEDHYAEHGYWENAGEILLMARSDMMGQGNQRGPMMGRPSGDVSGFRLADTQGNILFGGEDPSDTQPATKEELEIAIPLYYENDVVGYLIPPLRISFSPNFYEPSLFTRFGEAFLPTIIVSGSLALALAVLVGYFLLRPIRQLTQAATRLAEGDLTQRVDISGSDEMATLGNTFNHMSSSLEEAEMKRRAMTADIAHELRTPLAVQRANLEALQDGVYPLTQENLVSILEQNQLLTHLVEDLRTLALSDADELTLFREPTDITQLLEQITEQFQPQAEQQKIRLQYHARSCPEIPIDKRRFGQVLNNLLHNALQHTPEGGEIILTLNNTETHTEITVRDTGPGIPVEALPYIFERFYRTDTSRARDQGGSGLGLTIARRLAEAHNGELMAANHPDGGAVFKLILPITDDG
jgi:signal transduction histidine kinase